VNPQEIDLMKKDYVPYGSDVSAGTFECVDCGHQYSGPSSVSMPPCHHFDDSTHALKGWKILTGQGDAVVDPYPNEISSPVSKK